MPLTIVALLLRRLLAMLGILLAVSAQETGDVSAAQGPVWSSRA